MRRYFDAGTVPFFSKTLLSLRYSRARSSDVHFELSTSMAKGRWRLLRKINRKLLKACNGYTYLVPHPFARRHNKTVAIAAIFPQSDLMDIN